MNPRKILFVDTSEIMLYPELTAVLDQHPQHNWACMKRMQDLHTMANMTHGRLGSQVFPFNNTIVEQLNLSAPDYDPAFAKTFEEVTDQQCKTWLQQKSHRPWIICWSGGIDSTVVLAAILKNTTSADRENIRVACNRVSVYENPEFFYDHVMPNFSVVDSQTLEMAHQLYDTHYVIGGDLADQLYCGAQGAAMAEAFSGSLDLDCRRSPDMLLKFIAAKTDPEFAEWFYERLMTNINSVNVPVETYHDFWWWHFFNYAWVDYIVRDITKNMKSQDPVLVKKYLANHLYWYDTAEYQQWSMNNNQNKIKYGVSLAETKLPSKQYIYDFDHNEYYRAFKTKQDSTSRQQNTLNEICMLDDCSFLYEKDLALIQELLPAHIRSA